MSTSNVVPDFSVLDRMFAVPDRVERKATSLVHLNTDDILSHVEVRARGDVPHGIEDTDPLDAAYLSAIDSVLKIAAARNDRALVWRIFSSGLATDRTGLEATAETPA